MLLFSCRLYEPHSFQWFTNCDNFITCFKYPMLIGKSRLDLGVFHMYQFLCRHYTNDVPLCGLLTLPVIHIWNDLRWFMWAEGRERLLEEVNKWGSSKLEIPVEKLKRPTISFSDYLHSRGKIFFNCDLKFHFAILFCFFFVNEILNIK